MSFPTMQQPTDLEVDRGSLTQSISRPARRWLLPLVLSVVLILTAVFVWRSIDEHARRDKISDLETILSSDVAALLIWLEAHLDNVVVASRDEDVRRAATELARLTAAGDEDRQRIDGARAELRRIFDAVGENYEYSGFSLIGLDGKVIAADDRRELGYVFDLDDEDVDFVRRAASGERVVSRPFEMFAESEGGRAASQAVMYAAAPVRDDQESIVAVLGFRIPVDEGFTRILEIARPGVSGETYAFDKHGLMLSESHFTEQLSGVDLYRGIESSILKVRIRDPGGNLLHGHRPLGGEMPLTRMARDAIDTGIGPRSDAASASSDETERPAWIHHDVSGYRDYRGVYVIGAWTWLPDYEFGVATEIDYREAYAPLVILRRTFGVLFSLAAAGGLGVVIYNRVLGRALRRVRHAERKIRQLGQYSLDAKIGQGGMGEVYLASHALLRRPTAVKLLRPERCNDETIARFEREVQLTAQLTHPNTIAVYDFGRTRENVFYYAMEFLNGANLRDVVAVSGPMPEGRVVHILTQMCGSLGEAHGRGLVHRDVKPGNVFLCSRGGIDDFVKVLDFGLVKDSSDGADPNISSANVMKGTPLYMSPEAIVEPDSIDARSDLYLVGAVGYFLLTGTNVFDAENAVRICAMHVSEQPESPSHRLSREVDADLEQVLMNCLHKDPADRPQTAEQLSGALLECRAAGTWTARHARTWWGDFEGEKAPQLLDPSLPSRPETVVGPDDKTIKIDLDRRPNASAPIPRRQ